MDQYFNMFKRHSLKMWGSYMLGSLAASIPMIFLVITMVVGLIMMGVASFAGEIDPFTQWNSLFTPGVIVFAIVSFGLFFLAGLFASAFTSAGSIGIAVEAVRDDVSKVGTFFRYGFRRLFPMVGLNIVLFLLAMPPLILVVIGIFLIATGEAWGIVLGILLFLLTIPIYIAYAIAMMHAPTILIARQSGVFEAVAGSFNIFIRRFGQVLLSALIAVALSIGGGIVLYMISLLFTVGGWLSGADMGSLLSGEYATGVDMNPVSFFFNLIDVGVNFLLSSFLQVIVTTAIVFRYLWIIDPPPPSSGQATPITAGPNNHPNGPEPAHESTTDDPTDG